MQKGFMKGELCPDPTYAEILWPESLWLRKNWRATCLDFVYGAVFHRFCVRKRLNE